MKFEGMLKNDTLKGKTFIITGGGTGLGKSIGKYCMELGANLVITSRRQEVLDKTATELQKIGCGEVLAVSSDVRNVDDVQYVINSSINKFGRIDDITSMIIYLASDNAKFITGSEFIIDGGQTKLWKI